MTSDFLHEKRLQNQALVFHQQFIKPGDLCFDIGANVGNFTRIYLKLGARVICVEPQQECLRQLWKSFHNTSNVVIVGKAVGERESVGKLKICEEAPVISTLSEQWIKQSRFSKNYKWTKTQLVSVTTLDLLIQQYGLPKFCKVDIEGSEESALKGLTKPIPFITFEFTQEFIQTAERCIDRLSTIGYLKFNYTVGDYETAFSLPEWIGSTEICKRIKSVKNESFWGMIYARCVD